MRPSQKFGFRSSVQKNRLPGEGRHEGLVPRNDVLTNGFIGFSLARILFVPRLRPPRNPEGVANLKKAGVTSLENIRFSSLFAAGDVSRGTSPTAKSEEKRMFSQAKESLYNFFIVRL